MDFKFRFEEAANVEGNPVEAFLRYYQMIVAPYYYNMWTGIFGNGLGTATRAGAALAGGWGGAENSWARPVMENGVIVGSLFIVWRIWITKDLMISCIQAVKEATWQSSYLGRLDQFFFWINWATNQSWICSIWWGFVLSSGYF